MSSSLKERVDQFNTLELPGQPQSMHMGTSYLVHDLWCEIERLEADKAAISETASFYLHEIEQLEADLKQAKEGP